MVYNFVDFVDRNVVIAYIKYLMYCSHDLKKWNDKCIQNNKKHTWFEALYKPF